MIDKIWVTLLVVGLLGVGMVITGGILIPFFNHMIHHEINEGVALSNSSDSFKTWKDPPAPVYIEFYMFDVQNPKDAIAGSKPKLKQMGPYVYKEIRVKDNIVFHGDTMEYTDNKTYVFQPNISHGKEEDKFTSINMLYLTVASILRYEPELAQAALAVLLEIEGLFIEQTVGGYLFGYHDPLLHALNNWTTHSFLNTSLLPEMTGLFYGDSGNNTNDGLYNIYTGTKNVTLFNVIDQWKHSKTLNFWTTKTCNMINGTDGTAWHPFIEKTDVLQLFSSDICRSLDITYEKEYDLQGIGLYRFIPPPSVFAKPTTNDTANLGFCTPAAAEGEHDPFVNCLEDGVLNATLCKGAPIIMSQPHFYEGAKQYINSVEGLKPEKELHETFVDVEPMTGAAMNVSKKLQVNAAIHNLTALPDTRNISQKVPVFPILWLDEHATINDDGIHKFNHEVKRPIKITYGVKYGLLALGALIIFVVVILSIIRYIRLKRQGESMTPVMGEDKDPLLTSADDGHD